MRSLSLLAGRTVHGGESLTSKQQQWRIPLKTNVDSCKTFFDISVNTDQIDKVFKAEIPKNDSNIPAVYVYTCLKCPQGRMAVSRVDR